MSNDEVCKDKNDEICKDKIFDYAFGWFVYHAGQRVQIFQAFSCFVGFLYAAYALSISVNSLIATFFIAFTIVTISIVFLLLDTRNEVLVNIGIEALHEIENKTQFGRYDLKCRIIEMNIKKRAKWVNHHNLIRIMYLGNIIVIIIITTALEYRSIANLL